MSYLHQFLDIEQFSDVSLVNFWISDSAHSLRISESLVEL